MKKQQSKRRKLIGIVTLITILGGMLTMNWLNGEELKKKKYRQEQDRVVKYIGEHIELCNGQPITKIEFIEFQLETATTGTWSITAIVNEKYLIHFSEDRLGEEIRTSYYSPKEFKQYSEKMRNNMTNVETIYYEEK
ncbi:membrane protein [Streptococcus equi subsp. zooepidemicus]|uniref:Membrane protein n=2 Tax=Streptococcus equi TaxID=1336 RepID=A0A922T4W6_9STRE|nr:membrane protein [Streptococcus equi subsp. ruminatorum CECT 5772]SQF06218.1 membrane protein [Streptococcus equi subsp. zooepidemicus]